MQFMLWIWVALAVVTAIIEIATVEMVSIWFTAGSLCAIIAYAAKAPYWGQLIVFFVISFVFLVCFRKVCLKWVLKNVKEKTNTDALVGNVIKLTADIEEDKSGEAEINDVVWSVKGKDGYLAKAGEHVKIVGIEGNKLIVESVD